MAELYCETVGDFYLIENGRLLIDFDGEPVAARLRSDGIFEPGFSVPIKEAVAASLWMWARHTYPGNLPADDPAYEKHWDTWRKRAAAASGQPYVPLDITP